MPVHQGIKLSIVSQLELRTHPEFPHPESSQFTSRNPTIENEGAIPSLVPLELSSDSKADKILGRLSTVSVYIPSHPGARFWLRYDVSEAKEAPWYYFKLFMNGRHIASWGIDALSKPSGQVMRALYDPSSRWNYKHDETIYKNCGTETRPFYFSNVKERSAADDGGLIEVRAFRSKGRFRRKPMPAQFKPQDQYGLVLPSTGLIDDPHEAKFFDWILIDPKDTPYATFKFHYRSWDSLSSLHLIPNNHPRTLLFPSPSILSLNGQSANALGRSETAKDTDADAKMHVGHIGNLPSKASGTFGRRSGLTHNPNASENNGRSSNHSRTPLTKDTFEAESNDSEVVDQKAAFQVPRSPSPYYRNLSPHALQSLGFSTPPVPSLPPPSRVEWAQIMNRPLPEIPREINFSRSPRCSSRQSPRHSSRRSSASSAFSGISLTPSLQEHFDRGTLTASPTLRTATAVRSYKPRHPPTIVDIKREPASDNYHADSEAIPAPLTLPSKRVSSGILPDVTTRRNRKPSMSRGRSTVATSSSNHNQSKPQRRGGHKPSNDDTMPLLLTESEWLSSSNNLSRYRKSGRGRSIMRDDGDVLRKRTMDWYESAAGNATRSKGTSDSENDNGSKAPRGWI